MKEKCTKYEALFTFRDEAALLKHIEECEDCRKEHEKMQKVSALIQEAKPLYLKQKSISQKAKVACVAGLMLISGVSFGVLNYNYDIIDYMTYHNVSIEDMGFPTDEYGLLMVD